MTSPLFTEVHILNAMAGLACLAMATFTLLFTLSWRYPVHVRIIQYLLTLMLTLVAAVNFSLAL